VVCKIVSFTPDKDATAPDPNPLPLRIGIPQMQSLQPCICQPIYPGIRPFNFTHRIQGPGTYVIEDVHLIKGTFTDTQVSLPAIAFPNFVGEDTPPAAGDYILLLMKRDIDTGFPRPTDRQLSLILLSDASGAQTMLSETGASTGDPRKDVIRLLEASAAEPGRRQPDSYWLKDEFDDTIPKSLAPYIDDPNLETRANVLHAMLINQQAYCIPRAVSLEHLGTDSGKRTHTNDIDAFDTLQSPDAVQYLNPLIWDSYVFIRSRAMQALARLGDASSIPYLVLAARDPDVYNRVGSQSAFRLRQLIPDLAIGPADVSPAPIPTVAQIDAWWQDELGGKHTVGSLPKLQQARQAGSTNDPGYAQLWVGDNKHREKTINAVTRSAGIDAVPYLMLGLLDPDDKVSYKAYATLQILLKLQGIVPTEQVYGASRSLYTQPIFAWWSDELLGKHRQQPPTPFGVIHMMM
jgi:hypothetical protein